MQVKILTTDIELFAALSACMTAKVIGLDTETTALHPSPDNPTGRIRLLQLAPKGICEVNGTENQIVYVADLWKCAERGGIPAPTLRKLRVILESPSIIKIAHNAKFDIRWLMWEFERNWGFGQIFPTGLFCTYLADVLVAAGIPRQHSLAMVAYRLLGEIISKEEQQSDWSAPELRPEQLEYAAKDAELLLRLYPLICKELADNDLLRAATLEFDAIPGIADMENTGFPLDRDMWTKLLGQKIIARDESLNVLTEALQAGVNWTMNNPTKKGKRPVKPKKEYGRKPSKADARNNEAWTAYEKAIEIYEAEKTRYLLLEEVWQARFNEWEALPDQVPAVINLNSPIQVKTSLNNLGVPVDSTNEKVIAPLARNYPILEKLIDYRGKEKGVTSFGENFLERIERDGMIRAEFRQIGAEQTGRMSCSGGINLQQIPHDEGHRSCFRAPAGHKLTIVDYSQIEPRITACFSGDVRMIENYRSGLDAYKNGAAMMFGKEYEQITKPERTVFKTILLGLNYGMGANKLADSLGIAFDDARRNINQFFAIFPGVKRYLDAAAAHMAASGWTRTAAGRLIRFQFNQHDPEQVSRAERIGKNAPIQGTSADITKTALGLAFHRLKGIARLCNVVHDEIVVLSRAEHAQAAGRILSECMIEAGQRYVKSVPVVAEPLISDWWEKD